MWNIAMRFANPGIWPARRKAAVFLAVLAVLPAACGEPPKPFLTPLKSTIAASSVPASPRAALRIRNIGNLRAPGGDRELSQYLALALQNLGFTASLAGGFRGNYQLDGRLLAAPADGPVMMVGGRWSLYYPDGRLYFEAASSTRLTVAEINLNTSIGYRRIARDAARAIESQLYLYEAGAARRPKLPPLALAGISGAPADGNRQLAAAIVAALSQAGVTVSAGAKANGYLLRARIAPGKAENGVQRFTIVWRMIRPDQSEIGRFVQTEALPAGQSEVSWGPFVGRIAARARAGIVDLLQRLGSAGSH